MQSPASSVGPNPWPRDSQQSAQRSRSRTQRNVTATLIISAVPNPLHPPCHRLPLSSFSAARPLPPSRRRLPTLAFDLRSHHPMRWRLLRQTIASLWIPSIPIRNSSSDRSATATATNPQQQYATVTATNPQRPHQTIRNSNSNPSATATATNTQQQHQTIRNSNSNQSATVTATNLQHQQ